MKDLYFAFLTLKPLTGSSETDFFCSVKKQRGLSWLREIKLFLLISALSCSHVCLPSSIIFLKLFPLLHTPCPCTHFPSSLWKNKRRKCLSCPSLPLVVEAGAWQGRDTHTHTHSLALHLCTARLPELRMVTPTAALQPQLLWMPRRSEGHPKEHPKQLLELSRQET